MSGDKIYNSAQVGKSMGRKMDDHYSGKPK